MRLIPHKKKKNQVKEKLKKATYELLAEKGYASVSTRDIVKRADTALGQLTYYYKTKDSLINEVMDEIIEALITKLSEAVDTDSDKKEALKKCFQKFLDNNDNTQRIVIDLITQSFYSNNLSIKSSNLIDRVSEIIIEVIMDEDHKSRKEAEIDAKKYINYYLGTLIRKNIRIDNFSNISENNENIEKMTVKPAYN